jgi:mannosyl-3-phosphoglycerate phosphatase
LIFTDLDGTLLDHLTYSFQSARPALKILKERGIPLVFCTSKTRAETDKIRRQTENTHPFIVENGGAIFIPEDYFPRESEMTTEFTTKDGKDAEYQIIELGTPYAHLREALSQIQAQYPRKIRGFGDLSAEEIAKLCEFSLDDALLAKHREYDEPFVLEDESLINKIHETAKLSNLQITRGGRFYHLIGGNNKGEAVLRLIEIYRKELGSLKTIALGDSLNDLPMLVAVDAPILLPKPHGRYDSSVKLEGLILSEGTGPSGWCNAVLKIIEDIT